MPKLLHISSFIGLSVIYEIGRTCIRARMIFHLIWVFIRVESSVDGRSSVDGNCLSFQGVAEWILRQDQQLMKHCTSCRNTKKEISENFSEKNKGHFFIGNADVKQLQGLSPARSLPIHSQPGPH